MKKTIIVLILLLLCFISLVACEKEKENETGDLIFTYNSYRDDYTVSINPDVRWSIKAITIPATYDGKPITFISDFSYCTNLFQVTLPDSITHIGTNAFLNCTNLSEIKLPESLVSIDFDAFLGCNNLIKTEGGLSYVDNWLVDCDPKITEIQVRSGTVGIAIKAFDGCTITSLSIPEELKHISTRSIGLDTCSKLNIITVAKGNPIYHSNGNCLIETSTNTLVRGCNTSEIPSYVTTIGENAFCSSKNLKHIALPHGITTIQAYAFYLCSNLKSVTLPNSLTTIERCAFYHCTNLKNIIIPDGVTSIPRMTFANCTNLSTVILPNSVTVIENSTFDGCTSLEAIIVPAGVKYLPLSVTDHYTSLTVYYCGTNELYLDPFLQPTPKILYYKEQRPTENHGDYWRYVEGVPTAWCAND